MTALAAIKRLVSQEHTTQGKGRLQVVVERASQPDAPLYLTLFVTMLATSAAWYIHIPVVAIAIIGALFPATLNRSELWFGLAAILGANVVTKKENFRILTRHNFELMMIKVDHGCIYVPSPIHRNEL